MKQMEEVWCHLLQLHVAAVSLTRLYRLFHCDGEP